VSYVYLASPYSDPDPHVRLDRELRISRIGFKLIADGWNVFCPITMSHRLQDLHDFDTRNVKNRREITHEEWMRVDYSMLEHASKLLVAKLDGWDTSRGVLLEIEYAKKHGKPILYLDTKGEVVSVETTTGVQAGIKDSAGKAPLSLVPYEALEAIARVREYGNKKYHSPSIWRGHPEKQVEFVEAAMRHIAKYNDAKLYGRRSTNDEESGIDHLDHAITSLALAIALRGDTTHE
jgi:hypothetical protein